MENRFPNLHHKHHQVLAIDALTTQQRTTLLTEAAEEYCAERWEWTDANVNRLIQAASVAEKFTPIGVIPTKKSHVRPLLALESDDGMHKKAGWLARPCRNCNVLASDVRV